jgi:hypothetical protein
MAMRIDAPPCPGLPRTLHAGVRACPQPSPGAPPRGDADPPARQPTPQTTRRQDPWEAWHHTCGWRHAGGEHGERGVPPSRIVGETCQSWPANAEARGVTVAALPVRMAAGGPADPLVSGPHREPAGHVSGGRRGARARAVGSLRRDRARRSLPVWKLSVAVGRRRSDVTPAVVGQ